MSRYHRQIIVPEIGEEGQQKLRQGKVLVIGAGGLGCPVLQYLTAAGVGTIGIVDADVVNETNLQRQPLYTTSDMGRYKVEAAKERLLAINPETEITVWKERFGPINGRQILQNFDLLIDGTDNFDTRYFISSLCEEMGKPWIFASIQGWQGQVSFCNALMKDGTRSPSYHHLFPEPPAPGDAPSCNEIGVAGTLPAIIGSIQANEALKFLIGAGEILAGKLLMVDLLHNQFQTLQYAIPPTSKQKAEMKETKVTNEEPFEVNPGQLSQIPDLKRIDIREDWEYDTENNGAENIPYHELISQLEELASRNALLLMCERGNRSREVTRYARRKLGLKNVYSLEGGFRTLGGVG